MNILVTGGSGFIGTYLVNSLVETGNKVCILDNNSARGSLRGRNSEAEFIHGDICDSVLVDQLVEWSSHVYHLASTVGVMKVMSDPIESLKSSISGGINVLKACQKFDRRVLITSTSEVYGKIYNESIKEESDRILGQTKFFRWSYAESKALLESVAYAMLNEKRPLNFVIVRLFNTVGAGQLAEHGMVIPRFVRAALNDEPLMVFGDGRQTRTFCDVRDATRALIELMNSHLAHGDVFNIGSDEPISIYDLAVKVKSIANSQSKIEIVPYQDAYPDGYEDMLHRLPNTEKIKKLLNWEREYNLDEIIDSVIRFEKNLIRNYRSLDR